jgi:hypothetical protein
MIYRIKIVIIMRMEEIIKIIEEVQDLAIKINLIIKHKVKIINNQVTI